MKKIVTAVILLATAVPAGAELRGPVSDIHSGTPSTNRSLFVNPHQDRQRYYENGIDDPALVPTGDLYDVAPLAQDGVQAYYLTSALASNVLFDGTSKSLGPNLANTTSTFAVMETYQAGAGPNGGDVIEVELASINSAGALTPWVASGVTPPVGGGPFYTSWRMDVGNILGAAGIDPISPGYTFSVLSANKEAFSLSGGSFGITPMVDASTTTSLSGLALYGLDTNDDGVLEDIAGFGLGAIRMSWEIQQVPEPATISLLAVAGLALLGFRRR